MIALAPRSVSSRAAALGVLVAVIAMVWLLGVRPLADANANVRAALADSAGRIDRLRATLARFESVDAPDASTRFAGDFLAGTEEPLIAADLQARLRAIVVGHGGELSSARGLPARTQDRLMLLGLRLVVRAPIAAMQQILSTIEGTRPLLFVERAVLRLEERRGAIEGSVAEKTAMVAELDIYGAKWPGPTPATGAATGVATSPAAGAATGKGSP